jgi:hypothetical protein
VDKEATPPGGAGQGLAVPPKGVPGPWLPSVSALDFGFCFVQFQEYFLCSFSETQKQHKKENWHRGILLIG